MYEISKAKYGGGVDPEDKGYDAYYAAMNSISKGNDGISKADMERYRKIAPVVMANLSPDRLRNHDTHLTL